MTLRFAVACGESGLGALVLRKYSNRRGRVVRAKLNSVSFKFIREFLFLLSYKLYDADIMSFKKGRLNGVRNSKIIVFIIGFYRSSVYHNSNVIKCEFR